MAEQRGLADVVRVPHDTVEYSIAYGKPGATREQVEEAAALQQSAE